jgi:hypothetical protein
MNRPVHMRKDFIQTRFRRRQGRDESDGDDSGGGIPLTSLSTTAAVASPLSLASLSPTPFANADPASSHEIDPH